MRRLHLAELRDSWTAWLGVSVGFMIINFALALSALSAYSGTRFVLSGVISIWESTSMIFIPAQNFVFCLIIGAVVISSSTSLVIDSRRGSLARLALTGATPRQVVATVLNQLVAVSLASAVIGDLAAYAALRPTLAYLAIERGDVPVPPTFYPVWPVLVANLLAVGAAVLGGLGQARRASQIPPVEALRQSNSAPPEIMRTRRWVGAVLCGLVLVASFAAIPALVAYRTKETVSNMVVISMCLLIVTAALLALVAPVVVGPVTRVWTRLVPSFDPSWDLARQTALAKAGRLTKSVVPVMMAIGLLFGLQAITDVFVSALAAFGVDLQLSGSTVDTLLVFLALPLLIAFGGSVGSLIMMAKQRDAELALSGIVGTTPAQRLAMPIMEAVIITITGTILALIMVIVSVGYLAIALPAADFPFALVLSWPLFGLGLLGAAAITIAATVLPTLRLLRLPEPKVIARLVAE